MAALTNAIESVQALQNTTNDPRFNTDFRAIPWNGGNAARYAGIANHPDAEALAQVARDSHDARAELDTFRQLRAADPVTHARRCFLFAIVSPQCAFAENVAATRNLIASYQDLRDPQTLRDCLTVPYRGTGSPRFVNLGNAKAAAIQSALPWLDALTRETADDRMSYDNLIGIKGMGPKTSCMAAALYDERAEVFTLDAWMLRLTIALTSDDSPRVTCNPTTKGYDVTRADWLRWHAAFAADVSPFQAQWSLWNAAFGHHVSHLAIVA